MLVPSSPLAHIIGACAIVGHGLLLCVEGHRPPEGPYAQGSLVFQCFPHCPDRLELLHSACVSLEVLRRRDWVRERKKPTYIFWDFGSSDQSSWGLQCHAPQ